MIYDYGTMWGNLLTAAVFMLLELLLLWRFTKDFKNRSPGAFGRGWLVFAGWGLLWLCLTVLQCVQGTMAFGPNFLLRVAVVFVFLQWQYLTDRRFDLYIGLIFFLAEDIGKMTILDVIFPLWGLVSSMSPALSWIYIVASTVVQGMTLEIIRPRVTGDFSDFSRLADTVSVFFPILPYGLVKYLQIASYNNGGEKRWDVNLVCLMLSVCGLIILVQTQYRMNAEKARKEMDALRLRSRAQQEVYREEQRKLAQIGRIYHDMKHHLNYIQSLSDNSKIQEYVSAVAGELNRSQVTESTGNEVIDCVLARSQAVCGEWDICLIASVCGEVFRFMEPRDIMAIFGNALDNACEAVREVEPPRQREIVVRGDARQGFAVLRVENDYVHQLSYDREGGIRTTKEDSEFHGFGLKNIRASAKRYGGETAVETAAGKFILTVMLPVPSSRS